MKARILLTYICTCFYSFSNYCREVRECSSILKEMEDVITKYQRDLDAAVEKIRNLQVSYLLSL